MRRRAVWLAVLLVCAGLVSAADVPRQGGKSARGWVKALEEQRFDREAIKALEQMGPAALEALPNLLKVFDREDIKERFLKPTPERPDPPLPRLVVDTLAQMGSVAVPRLLDALKSPQEGVRAGAALALGLIRPPPRQTLPHLRAAMKDRDELVCF